MGISTYMSYRGAQIFEVLGLDKEFVDRYFPGTSCKVGGLGIFDVMREAIEQHKEAFADKNHRHKLLPTLGDISGEPAAKSICGRLRQLLNFSTPHAATLSNL